MSVTKPSDCDCFGLGTGREGQHGFQLYDCLVEDYEPFIISENLGGIPDMTCPGKARQMMQFVIDDALAIHRGVHVVVPSF